MHSPLLVIKKEMVLSSVCREEKEFHGVEKEEKRVKINNSITLTLAMFVRLLCVFGIFQHTAVIEHFRLTNRLFARPSNCEPAKRTNWHQNRELIRIKCET